MSKKTYFIFSDVHGEYDALCASLQEAGYDSRNPNHVLISIGDNFDRGIKSAQVFKFLRDNGAICVMGNHDLMFKEFLDKGMDGEYVLFNILHNGLGATIASFGGISESQFSITILNDVRNRLVRSGEIKNWINNMVPYFETKHCIFVHAGIDPNEIDWKNTNEHYRLWDIEDSHLPVPTTNKLVIIGHHHAFRVRRRGKEGGLKENTTNTIRLFGTNLSFKQYGNTDEHKPYITGNKMAIDGCTNYTGKVNVVVIEDEPIESESQEIEDIITTSSPEFKDLSVDRNGNVTATVNGQYYTIHTGVDYTTNPFNIGTMPF